MDRRHRWFLIGLFLTTLATLALEVLDTRLLSVLAWYHLSFFAVSMAMFGMSAGALRVYLGKAEFEGAKAQTALVHYATLFAISIPLAHLANLVIPLQEGVRTSTVAALGITTIALAFPFYMSGVVVTIALTRIPGRIGMIYAVDLLGASLGALIVLPALELSNLSSSVFLCGALAALGAMAFRMHAGKRPTLGQSAVVALLLAAMVWNVSADPKDARIMPWYPKGKQATEGRQSILDERWNIHSQVILVDPLGNRPFYWGRGEVREGEPYAVDNRRMVIDGNAATAISRWDGQRESLEWVKHDVTSLPYHLRQGGKAAIIGVGGGRDLLTALWAGSTSVTGVEINKIFLDLLRNEYREFAGLAQRPEVRFVHDEARSYLTRTADRYDVLQMSLIDTWAATGAGAFSLTENGLYTLEAWEVFLNVLAPDGIFSVSRWFDPQNASETSRLLALGTAALLRRGVAAPRDHTLLVASGKVATLLLSRTPFRADELARIDDVARTLGFQVLIAPDRDGPLPELQRIVASTSPAELEAGTRHELFDYSAPSDERPFFFNLLRPLAYFKLEREGDHFQGGVLSGNLKATGTLAALFGIALAMVLVVLFMPLVRSGLPRMSPVSFGLSLVYFGCIGFGFMLVQVPFMQRFSVYLGHPTYSVVVILFSMILAAGIGSLLSDRIPAERSTLAVLLYPLAIAVMLSGVTWIIQPVIDGTIASGLFTRCAVVVGLVTPISLLLGLCFPIGMRLVRRISDQATPWMWGVNGACGVLGAVIAVAVSMWGGIDRNLLIAVALYGALVVVAPMLRILGGAEPARGARLPAEPVLPDPPALAEV